MTEVAIDSYLQKVSSAAFISALSAYGLQKVATAKGQTLWQAGQEVPDLKESARLGIQTLHLTFARPITNFVNFAGALKAVPGGQSVMEWPRRPGQYPGITPADVQKADQVAAAAAAASKKAYEQAAKAAPAPKAAPKPAPTSEPMNKSTPAGVFTYEDGKLVNGTIQRTASGEFWAIVRIPVKENGSETTEKRFTAKSEKELVSKIQSAVGDTTSEKNTNTNTNTDEEEPIGGHVIKMKITDYYKKEQSLPLKGGDEIDIVKPFKIVNGVITNGDILYDTEDEVYWGVWRKPPKNLQRVTAEGSTEKQLISIITSLLKLHSMPV